MTDQKTTTTKDEREFYFSEVDELLGEALDRLPRGEFRGLLLERLEFNNISSRDCSEELLEQFREWEWVQCGGDVSEFREDLE